MARESLSTSQERMKVQYDRKTKDRSFVPGEQVLVLLPVPGSSLSARFTGPYIVEKKISDTNYIIKTPDRRRSSRLCHINMLKSYCKRDAPDISPQGLVLPTFTSVALVVPIPEVDWKENDEDGLVTRNTLQQCKRLNNPEMLQKLPSLMGHLDQRQTEELTALIHSFLKVFGEVPSRTSVLEHDVDVGNTRPIRQHPYRVNARKREIMKSEVDYLLWNGKTQLQPMEFSVHTSPQARRYVPLVHRLPKNQLCDCAGFVYITPLGGLHRSYWLRSIRE